MKKTILLAGWLLAACPAAFAQTHYLENLKLENQQVSKTGSRVTVSADRYVWFRSLFRRTECGSRN